MNRSILKKHRAMARAASRHNRRNSMAEEFGCQSFS
jgi:hypothetical protein